ncbi:MAG: hypothetical protein GTN86_02590 [Xanthomonadales bacterium]|nr:hypothetical protein [Xanthomonadales bacterium]NIN58906.1 hypothetical protein [Xanthomonadales bacterium]NIN74175.1 hypothetical protein [Xanthomonadales bacterium]NIO13846.1 hypothetical protein [Xanthomonadales bacterium]NIP11299.1 hypothetical protein [Xanthomonadales bacterium]
MGKAIRILLFTALAASGLLLSGCSANVGVGMSVGAPVGSSGYVRVGTSTGRWY